MAAVGVEEGSGGVAVLSGGVGVSGREVGVSGHPGSPATQGDVSSSPGEALGSGETCVSSSFVSGQPDRKSRRSTANTDSPGKHDRRKVAIVISDFGVSGLLHDKAVSRCNQFTANVCEKVAGT